MGLYSSSGLGALLEGRNKDRVRYYGMDKEKAGMGGGLHCRGIWISLMFEKK